MIRVRNRKGEILKFEDSDTPIIIEMLDADGKVGLVFIERSNNRITEVTPDSPMAKGYAKTFGVEFCKDFINAEV